MSKTLVLFDFDGTLTTHDTLSDFIFFSLGKFRGLVGAVILAPVLFLYFTGLMNNAKAKERVLSYFFKGIAADQLNALGQNYVRQRLPVILRPAGLNKIAWHQSQGHEVVIVSASAESWLKPWTQAMKLELIATALEVKDGKITGKFTGKNCHGQEKVRRIQATYNLPDYAQIFAYGDTPGDKPMLALATHPFYKPFK